MVADIMTKSTDPAKTKPQRDAGHSISHQSSCGTNSALRALQQGVDNIGLTGGAEMRVRMKAALLPAQTLSPIRIQEHYQNNAAISLRPDSFGSSSIISPQILTSGVAKGRIENNEKEKEQR